MADNNQSISFKDLVECRKQEMGHMLPGFQTEVKHGEKSVIVESPGWFARSKHEYNIK